MTDGSTWQQAKLALNVWYRPHTRVSLLAKVLSDLDRRPGLAARLASATVRQYLASRWGVFVAKGALIGDVHFAHPTSVVIGAGAVIESGVHIYQGVTLGARGIGESDYPFVGQGSIIYANATIIGGVTIGEGATIGANSVVVADVEAGTTVAGAPARPVFCS